MTLEIENKVIIVLNGVLKTPITRDQRLLTTGIIDSILLIEVIVGLESAFGITLEIMEISPTTFNSVEQISSMVKAKLSN